MLSSPTQTVEFTSPQQAAIEEAQTRVANAENTVQLAQKTLNSLKREALAITAERNYQEELLKQLEVQVTSRMAEKEGFDKDIDNAKSFLADTTAAANVQAIQHLEKEKELEEIEKVAIANEKKFAMKLAKLEADTLKLAVERESIDRNVSILKTAIETVSWK